MLANWIGLVGGGQTKLATRSPLPLGQISIEQIETEFFATVRSGSILQRMVEAQNLANLVAYLASPPLIRDKLRAYSPISIPSTWSFPNSKPCCANEQPEASMPSLKPSAIWSASFRDRCRCAGHETFFGMMSAAGWLIRLSIMTTAKSSHRIMKGTEMAKNTICLWFDKDAEEAANFYAQTFPDSAVGAIIRAPGDYPDGKVGNVLVVEFTVAGVSCVGLNGGPTFKHNEAFSFQISTENQEETDRYWNAIVGNGGQESECGWCKDRWGISWQITPRVLMDAMRAGGIEAKRAFDAMMKMQKIDVALIEAAVRG